ncbi:alcohol dehydrogenase [Xylariales sp. PMI_506]|nr:alcohol dehydrogenase [Xylariales sp. PMI_506]
MDSSKQFMRAAVVVRDNGGYRFEIQQVPTPEVKPWEVMVSLSVSGVCGTDVGLAAGYLGPSCDILGHEGVGRITALGSGVDPSTAKIGDRVGVAWVRDVCGKCACCRVLGGETRCVEEINSGRKRDGTFAEHCTVHSRYLLVLPEELTIPDELVAPILCGGVTAYKALKSCDAIPGDWVAIVGAAGGVGALGIQYAKAMGFRVLAIDVGRDREGQCLELGAEVYLDVTKDIRDGVRGATGGAFAKAVIVTAGSGAAYQNAFDIVAAFGTVVCVGIPPLSQTMSLHPLQFIDSGIKLIGVLVGTLTDTLEALDFVQRGVVKPITKVISLEELPDVVGDVGKVILLSLTSLSNSETQLTPFH